MGDRIGVVLDPISRAQCGTLRELRSFLVDMIGVRCDHDITNGVRFLVLPLFLLARNLFAGAPTLRRPVIYKPKPDFLKSSCNRSTIFEFSKKYDYAPQKCSQEEEHYPHSHCEPSGWL